MTSMERVLMTLGHSEPDRVPLFLLPTMHGARALGMSIEAYFRDAAAVVEGQLRMRARYGHDCLYGFFHAPLEVTAFGGEVVYVDDGPPNSGQPCVTSEADILALQPPRIEEHKGLCEVLKAIEGLSAAAAGEVPVIGGVMSPFSLPVMQMGFGAYLDLMHDRRDLFDRLMAVNEAFARAWANAQLAAGATAICYFDPVSSPTVIPRALYRRTGFEVARRTLPGIQGPTATHLASGRALAILDDLVETGTAIVGVGAEEDLAELKAAARGKLTLLGNLNGLRMRRWTTQEAEQQVKASISAGAAGGGFILADNHGEIPWQVSEDTLDAIAEATRRWGRYPLDPTLQSTGVA